MARRAAHRAVRRSGPRGLGRLRTSAAGRHIALVTSTAAVAAEAATQAGFFCDIRRHHYRGHLRRKTRNVVYCSDHRDRDRDRRPGPRRHCPAPREAGGHPSRFEGHRTLVPVPLGPRAGQARLPCVPRRACPVFPRNQGARGPATAGVQMAPGHARIPNPTTHEPEIPGRPRRRVRTFTASANDRLRTHRPVSLGLKPSR